MAIKKETHGKHQRFHVGPFRTDKNNILSGVIELHQEEEFDKPDWQMVNIFRTSKNLGGVISLPNLNCEGIERTYDEKAGMAIYSFALAGLPAEIFEPNEEPTFELDITMREEPIETHPTFESLARNFFWNYERKEFARNIPQDTSKAGLASANDPSKRATNPMYGVTSYLVPGVVYRRSYSRRAVPGDVLENIGTIVKPPGIQTFPELQNILAGSGRNWLKLAPKIVKRGNAVAVTEEYLLSGPRGVLAAVYDRAVLEA